uniref:Uncharacterized protein n=1 Tax=Ciona savignyi TaxID=51511 RepID=H2ZBM5_CIOSA
MLLDMDAELQHLINISMDKMTSGASSDLTGRGGRKSRAMDLRKALLVAHVLQEVRCAYLDEDYQIVANTLTDIHSEKYSKDHETEYEYSTVKEVNERCIQESLYLREDDIKSVPQTSPTVLQSCMTNSDVMVSRIAQVTRPMAVSINTNHVVSYQSLDHPTEDDSDPIVCEELEVSSCCEVVSSDEILPHDSETDEYVDVVNVSWTQEAPKVPDAPSSPKPSCPLPRKKRPLPKEFLDSSPSKICRTNNCDVTSTTTSYTPTTSTSSVGLESRT